tara:strand:- start:10866 stop:11102 length:237 start_codon:yes stop_codon:yes gene_type:complete
MVTPLNNIKSIFKSIGKISEVFKGDNKKWSAKRSVSGVLVSGVMLDVANSGITWENCLMAFIAVAPLIASSFEKKYVK